VLKNHVSCDRALGILHWIELDADSKTFSFKSQKHREFQSGLATRRYKYLGSMYEGSGIFIPGQLRPELELISAPVIVLTVSTHSPKLKMVSSQSTVTHGLRDPEIDTASQ